MEEIDRFQHRTVDLEVFSSTLSSQSCNSTVQCVATCTVRLKGCFQADVQLHRVSTESNATSERHSGKAMGSTCSRLLNRGSKHLPSSQQHYHATISSQKPFRCRSNRTFSHQVLHTLLAVLLILHWALFAHSQPSTQDPSHHQTQSLSKATPLKDIFFSPDTWTVEEIDSLDEILETHTLQLKISKSVGYVGRLFRAELDVDLPGIDLRDSSMLYLAREAGRKSLPSWLHLETLSGELIGVPLSKDSGKVYITVDVRISTKDRRTDHLSEVFPIHILATKPRASSANLKTLATTSGTSLANHNAISECVSKSSYPVSCPSNETPIEASVLFITDFSKLHSQHRANLILAMADLVGSCSDHIWLSSIDWDSKEGVRLWSQLADSDFKTVLGHSAILSFLVGCRTDKNSPDLSRFVGLMDNVLSICVDGIPLDDDAYKIVDCYKWFISSGMNVISQSRNVDIESETLHNRMKRQVLEGTDEDYDYLDQTDPPIEDTTTSTLLPDPPMTSSTPLPEGTSTATATTPSSTSEVPQVTSSLGAEASSIAVTSTLAAEVSSIEISSTVAAEVFSTAITSTVAAETSSTSVAMSSSTLNAVSSTSSERFGTINPTPSTQSTVLVTPSQRVIPSSTFLPGQSGITETLTSTSSTRAPISSSEFFEPLNTAPQFVLSSIVDFESITTVMQMVITPTTSKVFSFSINPSIDDLDSLTPSLTPSSIQPTSSFFSSFTTSSFQFSSPVFSTPAVTTERLATTFQTNTPVPTPVPTTRVITPSPAPSTSSPTFMLPSSTIGEVDSTSILFSFGSSDVFTSPVSTASLLVPMPTSELSLSISMFTPSEVPTSVPVTLSVFTPALSQTADSSVTFIAPTTSLAPEIETTILPSFSSPVITTSSSDFFDISTSAPVFTITPSLPLSSSTPVITSLPSTTEILTPTPSLSPSVPPQTTEIFFTETSDIFFPDPTTTVPLFEITPTPSSIGASSVTVTSLATSTSTVTETLLPTSSVTSSLSFSSVQSSIVPTFTTSQLSTSQALTSSFDSETFIFPSATTNLLMPFTSTPVFTTTAQTTATSAFETFIFPSLTSDILMPFSTPVFTSSIQSTSVFTSVRPSPTPTPDFHVCDFIDCNNGTCLDLDNSDFVCECFTGWTGQFCDVDIDYCFIDLSSSGFSGSGAFVLEPCDPQGTSECIDGNSTYTCICLPGHTGRNCSEDIDECLFEPCMNNATCINERGGSVTCECTSEYTGPFCEIDIDPCTPNPCFPDEVCIDVGEGFFECENITVSTPILSTTSIESFIPTTILTTSIATSFAPATTIFPTPSPNVSICDFANCSNGTCVDLGEEFQCDCYLGWTGQYCDVDIDYCAVEPCSVNGTVRCVDGNSTYTCECEIGFTGRNCSIDIDDCAQDLCMNNATCIDEPFGMFTCQCESNFTGPLCGIDLNPCRSNPCASNETCINSNGTFTCVPLPTTTITSSVTTSTAQTSFTPIISSTPTTSAISSSIAMTVTTFTGTIQPSTPTVDSTTPSLPVTTMTASSTATSIFSSTIIIPSPTPTPGPVNTNPVLLNPIATLLETQGQVFQFTVPDNTFFDQESGGAHQLTLTLLDSNGNQLPNTTWIQLRYLPGNIPVVEGLPLSDQVEFGALTDHVFLLRAEDGSGGIVHDFVTIRVGPPSEPVNNLLTVFFEGDFEVFNQNLTAKIELYMELSSFGLTSDIFIDSFSSGSIAVTFSDLSIPNLDCAAFLEWVQMIFSNGQYTEEFIAALTPFIPTKAPQIEGPCADVATTPTFPPPTTGQISPLPTSNQVLLLATVIPLTILACLCLCIGILAFVLYRRRRSERELLTQQTKGTFLHRRPIILEGELDLPPRSRRPVILTNELRLRDEDEHREVPQQRLLLQEIDGADIESESEGEEVVTSPLLTLSRVDRFSPQPDDLPPEYILPPVYSYTRFRY